MSFHQVPVWELSSIHVTNTQTLVTIDAITCIYRLHKLPGFDWHGVKVWDRDRDRGLEPVHLPKEFTRQLVVWLTMEGRL